MTKQKGRYPEKQLTEAFTKWLTCEFGYQETFEDVDTGKGAPIDSVGFIGRQLVLIEYKNKISRGAIWYKGSRGSSIEKKIGTALNDIYHEKHTRIAEAARRWDRLQPPLFILAANSISKSARQELNKLLRIKSRLWRFHYRVYLWNGDRGDIILEDSSVPMAKFPLNEIIFPEMPSTAPKRTSPRLTFDDLERTARELNIEELFDRFWGRMERFRPRQIKNISNINFAFPRLNHEDNDAGIGIWPKLFDQQKGIFVTYSPQVLKKCFRYDEQVDGRLPGIPKDDVGHLGRGCYLRTLEDVDAFWDALGKHMD